jgi:hypothetical protein
MKPRNTVIWCAMLFATVFSQSVFGSALSIGPNGMILGRRPPHTIKRQQLRSTILRRFPVLIFGQSI